MRSIRSFLLTRLVGGATVVLLVAGIGVTWLITRYVEGQFDDKLEGRLQGLASLLHQFRDEGGQEHIIFNFSEQLMPEYAHPESPAYFQLWREGGALLERSDSLEDEGRGTELDLAFPREPSVLPTWWSAPLPDGRAGRFVAQLVEIHHVYPEEGPNRPTPERVTIVIGHDSAELAAARRAVLLWCGGVCLALIGLMVVLSWRSVAGGLRPSNRLAATLDAIDVENLPARLEVGELPAELQPMAATIDALLHRVEDALQRERRTTADIAHQLRTPISEILTASEVALMDGEDPEVLRKALATVRDVAWRMGGAVSTLLKFARVEMGHETFETGAVDMGAIVAETLRSLSGLERDRGLAIANRVEPGDEVAGDPDVLSIVVANLLSNALYYTPRGGDVECRLERPEGGWRLVVENEAADLEAADLASIARPFWRKDRARNDPNRSGLGLALSRAMVEKTGNELRFELEGRTFRAVLSSRNGAGGGSGAAA